MVADARDLLFEELERHDYPIREIETLSETEEVVELAAILAPTTASARDLDMITAHLEARPTVERATWTVSADA
jgi:putative Mg2+ transporter-C (MgtC) family protein